MELIFEHPFWVTLWLIIIFGAISNVSVDIKRK